jgi:two-component system, OmpR family, phosphate regulon response regulator PhoB
MWASAKTAAVDCRRSVCAATPLTESEQVSDWRTCTKQCDSVGPFTAEAAAMTGPGNRCWQRLGCGTEEKTDRAGLLIVDDQPSVRQLLEVALAGRPYFICVAQDGLHALRKAAKMKPEVILLDVMMPGRINGLDVCRTLKAEPAHERTFIAVISALGLPTDVAAAKEAGADAYLVKPFRLGTLVDVIERRNESPRKFAFQAGY